MLKLVKGLYERPEQVREEGKPLFDEAGKPVTQMIKVRQFKSGRYLVWDRKPKMDEKTGKQAVKDGKPVYLMLPVYFKPSDVEKTFEFHDEEFVLESNLDGFKKVK